MKPFVALFLAFLLWGCGEETPPPVSSNSSGVSREMQGFDLTETRDGKPAWTLHAESAWRLPKQSGVHLRDVVLTFFDEAGAVRSRLVADRGTVDENSGDMTALGNVTVVSSDRDTLYTDELHYDRNEDRIHGPGFVRLADPRRVLTGTGFEADPDLTRYKVHEDVHIIAVGDEKSLDAGS